MALPASKLYLLAYNVLQTGGWIIILIQTCYGLATSRNLWDTVNPALKIFQTLAVLEVVHTSVGLVRSSPVITAVQVASRIFVLWSVLNYDPQSRTSVGFPLLLAAWSFAEIIRYAFYAMNLLSMNFHPLVWLRYTMFIVLYPLGVTGELFVMYAALKKYSRRRPFSLDMPNRFNIAIDTYILVILLMLSYAPVFPMLYGHMLSQRKKVLAGDPKPAKKLE